jgi:DNA-binding MarR family transcriptional regulator
MRTASEIVQLLVQSTGTWLFEDSRLGLTDREWAVLRFLAHANRFSRTPSALASFLSTTRSTASQISAVLQKKGLVDRRTSAQDKRSITLGVTPQGKKFLARDPINALRDQIASLGLDDQSRLRDALRRALVQLDANQRRHYADTCSKCIFLAETRSGKDRHLKCRRFRKTIVPEDTGLLCTSFEERIEKSFAAQPSSLSMSPQRATQPDESGELRELAHRTSD